MGSSQHWQLAEEQKRRIAKLLYDNLAYRLTLNQHSHQLQQYRADKGLLEYNRDRIYERYEKWKGKTHTERQNNLILQQ